MPNSEFAKAIGISLARLATGFWTRAVGRRIMDDLIRVGALVAITVLSVQMGLFFNWALLSLMLKAMNRVRPTASGSTKPSPTSAHWA